MTLRHHLCVRSLVDRDVRPDARRRWFGPSVTSLKRCLHAKDTSATGKQVWPPCTGCGTTASGQDARQEFARQHPMGMTVRNDGSIGDEHDPVRPGRRQVEVVQHDDRDAAGVGRNCSNLIEMAMIGEAREIPISGQSWLLTRCRTTDCPLVVRAAAARARAC